jgi:dnd system-associated protein 4
MTAFRFPNINRSQLHEESVVQLLCTDRDVDAERSLFPTIRELLVFAALLGYSENRRVPLDKTQGVIDISYQQFEHPSSDGADEIVYLIALSEEKDLTILRRGNENKCAEIFEEYANGGLEMIRSWLSETGFEYPNKTLLEHLFKSGYLVDDDKNSSSKQDIDLV